MDPGKSLLQSGPLASVEICQFYSQWEYDIYIITYSGCKSCFCRDVLMFYLQSYFIHIPNTPIASPPRAIPIAWPLSSSSVYTLASIPIPENTKVKMKEYEQ